MRRNGGHRRGSAFITTVWVLIALSGLVLVLSRSMRVEAIASANRLSQFQADATERGAEQFLCSVVDAEVAQPGVTANVSMEAKQIGAGYFWVMKPDPDDENTRQYGLTDEGGKVDLNTAPLLMLQMLPNMPQDVASSIYNWRGQNNSGDGLGATDADYEALTPDPYLEKHALFETTGELMLIKNMTTDLLFGLDKNRDGTVDPAELQAGGSAPGAVSPITVGTNSSNRGIFPYVTAYGVKATTSATVSSTGQRVVNVNTASQSSLTTALQSALGGRTSQIVQMTMAQRPTNRNGPVGPGTFRNIFDWAVTVGLQSSDFSKVISLVSASSAGRGGAGTQQAKINVNTAPLQVLMCIPNLQQGDAQSIVSYRQSSKPANPADVSWLIDVVPQNELRGLSTGNYFTGTSCVFSGDIVAVSPDGRAFRRYRVVIDGSKTPAYVIYRRDLTGLGWPLPAEIRTALRSGKAPPDVGAAASGGSNSLLGKGL